MSWVTVAFLKLLSTPEASIPSIIRAKCFWVMDVGQDHFPRPVSFVSPNSASTSLLVWRTHLLLLPKVHCSSWISGEEETGSVGVRMWCWVGLWGWSSCIATGSYVEEHHLSMAGGRGGLWGNLGSWKNLLLPGRKTEHLEKEKRSWSDTYFIQFSFCIKYLKNKMTFNPKNQSIA